MMAKNKLIVSSRDSNQGRRNRPEGSHWLAPLWGEGGRKGRGELGQAGEPQARRPVLQRQPRPPEALTPVLTGALGRASRSV